jgi:hypothetical protein
VFLQKSDRLVSIGIADAGFHRSLYRAGWLVLCRLVMGRLGGLRLGRGRLIHNHQYPRELVKTKINRRADTTRLAGVEQESPWAV